MVDIFTILACASQSYWRVKNDEFYETTSISVWLTVFQLFNVEIDPNFKCWKVEPTLSMFWHIKCF